jgi:hypothetical protein
MREAGNKGKQLLITSKKEKAGCRRVNGKISEKRFLSGNFPVNTFY